MEAGKTKADREYDASNQDKCFEEIRVGAGVTGQE